ncbi:MAG: FKBP-type peptidyl-prolyl cis-trans isomerase [Gammaproteobacteria bacterium]|nr:FKBP-type peptidyl-prolyl cis-trans isomerase [Gammaproteobacteria bacterium]
MPMINRGSLVTLQYSLGLTDDSVLEDNFDEEPMTVQLGSGEMAEGLELALLGLRDGDEQTIDIGPDMAFGPIDDTLLRAMPRADFDPALELQEGLIIEFSTAEGESLPGTILAFDENEVRIDLNHPLAGQTVRFRVKILEVAENSDAPVII